MWKLSKSDEEGGDIKKMLISPWKIWFQESLTWLEYLSRCQEQKHSMGNGCDHTGEKCGIKIQGPALMFTKRKRGHDGFLAFEFENSSRLGQLLIRLCIPPRSQGRRWCQSPVEYIRGDYSLLDPPALACTTEQGGDVSERWSVQISQQPPTVRVQPRRACCETRVNTAAVEVI